MNSNLQFKMWFIFTAYIDLRACAMLDLTNEQYNIFDVYWKEYSFKF